MGSEGPRRAAGAVRAPPVRGPAGECDWVALREIVPAATARVRAPAGRRGGRRWPPCCRWRGRPCAGRRRGAGGAADGPGSGDASRDVAVLRLRGREPGTPVENVGVPGPGPRLQDVLDPAGGFEVTVHPGFDFWLDGVEERRRRCGSRWSGRTPRSCRPPGWPRSRRPTGAGSGSAGTCAGCCPTRRRTCSTAWPGCTPRKDRRSRRGPALGAFRTHGLVVPVWDLTAGTEAADLEEPAPSFAGRLAASIGSTTPLTPEQRRARAGVVARQLTLR